MNNSYINKVTGLGVLGLTALAMTGCVGTKHLSAGINDAGQVEQENIVFPDLDDAWQKSGQFPNSENLEKIKPGIDKDDLYDLIGAPHFSERHKAREWDYIFKFYDENQDIKICQYKVIFDKEYKGQEFYWLPADCPPQPTMVNQSNPAAAVQPGVKRISLSADALFEFDKSSAQDIVPRGKDELDELAQTLRQYQGDDDSSIVITGHTDRKGDASYNMNLSTDRAYTVANYLVSQGVNPNTISAVGAGETQPIKECSTDLPRQQEIDCLQPNRRVTLDITVN
ncbi:MAG: OmpA family protein [Psychrobacter sp.]|uniref:OmpA family protein n=3 Tax=Psychrobacter sp. TaxID=56811 RepID=UPI00265131A9|nr:OmpA family protein [Psychrobacter sp.]